MRALSRLMLAFALLGVLVLPMPANAVVRSTCGGTWTNDNQCTFFLTGSYLYIDASSTGNSTYLWVSDAANNHVFLSCQSLTTPGNRSHCSAETGRTVTGGLVEIPTGVPLTCHVAGIGSGTYSCYGAAI